MSNFESRQECINESSIAKTAKKVGGFALAVTSGCAAGLGLGLWANDYTESMVGIGLGDYTPEAFAFVASALIGGYLVIDEIQNRLSKEQTNS